MLVERQTRVNSRPQTRIALRLEQLQRPPGCDDRARKFACSSIGRREHIVGVRILVAEVLHGALGQRDRFVRVADGSVSRRRPKPRELQPGCRPLPTPAPIS